MSAEYAVLIPAYLVSGWSVLTSAGRNILRGKIFDENFLMTIATLGAIAIHELPEAKELLTIAAIARAKKLISKIEEAKVEKILAEHNQSNL